MREHRRQQQNAALVEEIDLLEEQLGRFDIEFDSLEALSPKHERVRQRCMRAALRLTGDTDMARQLARTGRLPVSQLAKASGVPIKTIEKFRKYIITIAIIYINDYSGIAAFLPEERRNT